MKRIEKKRHMEKIDRFRKIRDVLIHVSINIKFTLFLTFLLFSLLHDLCVKSTSL